MSDPARPTAHRQLLARGMIALALGLGIVLAQAVIAQAAVPDHGGFSSTEDFVDSEVCSPEGFAVTVTQTESADYRRFFNSDGSVKQTIVHWTYMAVISANGHTIFESDNWQDFYYPDGSRLVGLTVHIRGPGGLVQLDVGQVIFNSDGTAIINGPHPQFEGQTFCPALLP
jgi:hypothetical protein